MRLRDGINYEAWIRTVWNVGANEKFWRPLEYHLQAGQGNLRNSDTASDAIGGSHIQIIRSDRAFALVVLESVESFKRGTEKKIPFDAILDGVTGSDPSVTGYVLEQAAKCPICRREILEDSIVQIVR